MKIVRYFAGMKFSRKILITNLILFVIPCTILSIILFGSMQKEANRERNESRLVILNQVNDNLDDMFEEIVLYTRYFQCNTEINKIVSRREYTSDYEQIQGENTLRQFFGYSNIVYNRVDYNMQMLCESGFNFSTAYDKSVTTTYPVLRNLQEETWYRSLEKESNRVMYIPTWISPEFSAAGEENVIQAVCLVKNLNSGRVVGMVNVDVKQEMLADLFHRGTQNASQQIFLMDDAGQIISSTNESIIGSRVESESYLDKLQNYYYGYFRGKIDGVMSQVSFVTNDTTGWKVVLYDESKAAVWTANNIFLSIIIISLVYLLLALMMTAFNTFYINRPLKKLKDDMQMIYQQGDLSIRSEVQAMDEFGEVSLQFNETMGQIQNLIHQLEKKEEEQRTLEIQALQAQINPHFLYNTLASIRFLIEMEMVEKAGQSLIALAQLLKRTYSNQQRLVTVKEEIEAIENYLILMSNRYQDTFTWEIHMEAEIEHYGIPKLSVQPLVENAILHGFGEKEGIGNIKISGYMEEGTLVLSISDDGIGGDLDKINEILSCRQPVGGSGRFHNIGIHNVQQRLRLMFGEPYGLAVIPSERKGIRFDIRIPPVKAD